MHQSHYKIKLLGLSLILCLPHVSQALEFEKDGLSINIDTTLSYGQAYRVSNPNPELIGLSDDPANVGLLGVEAAMVGTAFSENVDDGNQNFDTGLVSNTLRFTSELDAQYKNFGVFMRVRGFKDFVNDDAGDRTPLAPQAERFVAENLNLLDLYAWSEFEIADRPASIKIGEQVLSWGESTFIQNGINVINPFNVSQLRTPGSEVRDALLPVGIVSFSIAPTDNTSLEAYYQYDWERTILEPSGSFFSTNDFVSDGGQRLFLNFGGVSDRGTFFGPLSGVLGGGAFVDAFDEDFLAVPRAEDERPDNGGEFGFSIKYFAEELNDTELGFYFINHHSRTPIVSAITGTQAGVNNAALGAAAATAVFGSGSALVSAIATDQYAQTARYFVQYPEDIQRLGLSFNTQFKGIALQGEYTFVNNAPLQVDDIELLIAALCPISGLNPVIQSNQIDPGCANLVNARETVIPGFIERNISQVQVTASKIFSGVLKANQGALVAEVGVTHVHGLPDKSDLRLNSAGTFTSGNTIQSGINGLHQGLASEAADNFADATSWGYRIAGGLTYNNVFAGINVLPRIAWSHDVSGNSPGPGGNFLEDRKAISLGVGFDYQNSWQADFSYTNFFGAGRLNLLSDRDFASFNLKYSF